MKKISYFADFGSEKRTGGGQTFARELFKILDKLPVELTAFTSFYPEADKKISLLSPKIVPVTLPFTGTFGMPQVGIPWSLKLRGLLKKMPRQDLYIFDQPQTWPLGFPEAPAVSMFHGTDYVRPSALDLLHPRSAAYSWFWQKPILNRVQKNFLTKRNATPLFNSRYTLELLARDFKIDPAPLQNYVTYLPFRVSEYEKDMAAREKVRSRFRVAPDEILVIYFSNFAPKKRADRIPPIVREIFERLPDSRVKFIFVGRGIASGPIDSMLEEKNMQGRCFRVGEVAPAEVREFYSASDIALSTSESETFGYFIAEGMAAKLPFVAYREGSVPELIQDGETGLLADSKDKFVDALTSLIQDRELREMLGRNSYERVKKEFSEKAFEGKFLKILREEYGLVF